MNTLTGMQQTTDNDAFINYAAISALDGSDYVAFLLDNYYVFIKECFIRCRLFDEGMRFADMCEELFSTDREKYTDFEMQGYEKKVISIRLAMYDYLNMWKSYIDYHDCILRTKLYPTCLNVFPNARYEIRIGRKKYYHFLSEYEYISRYDVIKRKYERLLSGKNVEHLKRHQRIELSDEDIRYRFDVIQRFYFDMTSRLNKYKKY